MPVLRQWTVFEICNILIWEIAETPQELQNDLVVQPEEWAEFTKIVHPQKQLEWLAGRKAMQTLFQSLSLPYEGMTKDPYGKPHLAKRVGEISVTHTVRYIGVVTHPTRPVGIDLERVAPKLAKVASKYLNPQEQLHAADHLNRLCTYWCGKEALYKLHGTRHLSFKEEIFIHPFHDSDTTLRGTLLPHRSDYSLHRFEVGEFGGVVAV